MLFVSALALALALINLPAIAATPAFTISATNITMPSNGSVGSSPFVLVSVNGYEGRIRVDCAYSGDVMGAKVPSCGIFVNPVSALAANKTAQGSLTLIPFGKTITYGAASVTGKWPASMPVFAAAIVGGFLLRRIRKGARGWLPLLMLGAIAVAGVSTCASGKSGRSGMFPYTVTAVDMETNATVSAPFTVTVP
jgi:hypothetical protein